MGYDTAVGQAEHNILREIPARMKHDRCPETVIIIYEEGHENPDQKDLQQTDHRKVVISQVQSHKDQGVAQDRHGRMPVPSAEFLIEVAPVHDLLASRLDRDHKEKGEKEDRIEAAPGKLHIPPDDGHQDAEPVGGKASEKARQGSRQAVSSPPEGQAGPHGPVVPEYRDHQEKHDPDPDKGKIQEEECHSIPIAQDTGQMVLRVRDPEKQLRQKLSRQCQQKGQDRGEEDHIRDFPGSPVNCSFDIFHIFFLFPYLNSTIP